MAEVNLAEFIRSCNGRKTKTKLKHIMMLKKYYLSMYRCYCIMLYDKGYIEDPTKFDMVAVRKLLLELGVKSIVNKWGKVDLSANHVLFCYYKNKSNVEVVEFLYLLYNALRYQEYSREIDRIYEEYYTEDLSVVVKTTMKQKGSMIVQQSGMIFDECLASCIVPFEKKVRCETINDNLWALAMQELHIPNSDWYKDGVFDSSLNHDEEVMFLDKIFNGDYNVSGGLHTDILTKWLCGHKWNDNNRYKADMKGLYDYLFVSCPMEVSKALSVKVNSLNKLSEGSVIAIDRGSIYYTEERTDLEIPFGQFVVMCDSDCSETILPDMNIVHGFTGEVYTEERLIEDDISYVGCPIYVDVSRGKQVVVYDLEQTDIKSDSWFKTEEGMDLSFEKVNLFNPFSSGTLEYQIYQGYINSLCSSDTLITKINVSNLSDLEFAKRNVANKII